MSTFITSLYFNGNCEEAFNFYRSIFGGEFRFVVRHNDPSLKNPNLSKEDGNKISCILYQTGQGALLGEDVLDPKGIGENRKNNIVVTIHPETKEDTGKIFNALSAGGEIKKPLAVKTPDYIGSLTDKFGISWRVWWFDQTQAHGTAGNGENITGELFELRDMPNSLFREVNMQKARFDYDNLDGAAFDRVFMPNTIFHKTGLNNSIFNSSSLENAVITNDTSIRNMKISNALYEGLTIDDIPVQPLVEAEKDRLDPERVRLMMKDIFDPAEVVRVMKRLDGVSLHFSPQ